MKNISRKLLSGHQNRLVDKAIKKHGKPPVWAYAVSREKREQIARWRPQGSPFNIGQKKVYLPKFSISLERNERLPPDWAQFQVPLWFSKLDLRDYLYHAYNLRLYQDMLPRAYVHQPRVRINTRKFGEAPYKKLYARPQSIKKMLVRLDRPFVWPADLTERELDEGGWDHKKYMRRKEQAAEVIGMREGSIGDYYGINGNRRGREAREKFAERAKELLQKSRRNEPLPIEQARLLGYETGQKRDVVLPVREKPGEVSV